MELTPRLMYSDLLFKFSLITICVAGFENLASRFVYCTGKTTSRFLMNTSSCVNQFEVSKPNWCGWSVYIIPSLNYLFWVIIPISVFVIFTILIVVIILQMNIRCMNHTHKQTPIDFYTYQWLPFHNLLTSTNNFLFYKQNYEENLHLLPHPPLHHTEKITR